uniref:Uncharacterized protein n=1 Tax=Phyllostachys edulis TaxID=38705 RepID=D3IVL9_PHYED|nr:hypothetical protein [Phyllostachys edulis]
MVLRTGPTKASPDGQVSRRGGLMVKIKSKCGNLMARTSQGRSQRSRLARKEVRVSKDTRENLVPSVLDRTEGGNWDVWTIRTYPQDRTAQHKSNDPKLGKSNPSGTATGASSRSKC